MLYMKACPRCSGDVKLDRDNYGVYAKCLQCGFNRDFVTKRNPFGEAPAAEPALAPEAPAADRQREAA